MPTRGCAKGKDVVLIDCVRCAARRRDMCLKMAVLDPYQHVAHVLHRPFQQVHLWAQPVVGHDNHPAAVETILDLVRVDHARRPEHERAAMDVDDWEACVLASNEGAVASKQLETAPTGHFDRFVVGGT